MATIWRAVHTTLDRPVAVKFLQAIGSHAQQMAARFVQEAKLCAGLRHRNVVDVLDFGVTADEQPFMVMELLEGQSLADRYETGPPLTDWDILEICAMTLSGLAAVHDAGIIHRDVKPENVFLAQDADGTYPKLIDFGVSKGLHTGQRITRTGAVVGTPEYMSPEQARGKADIGPASDLWSVGILLYEGFTGEVPFESENPGDVLVQVATEEVPSLALSRPDLPAALVAVVARACQRDPADRFGDAREMRDALLAVLEGSRDLRGRPPSKIVRHAYASGPETGKLRALSRRPPAPGIEAPEVREPSGPVGRPIPLTTRISAPPAEQDAPIETAKLRPPRATSRRRAGWVIPTIALGLVALSLGALALLAPDTLRQIGLLPSAPDRANAASGQVRPGQDVAALTAPVLDAGAPTPEEPATFEPPPAEGVAAPETETIDVPSPPDPPGVDAR